MRSPISGRRRRAPSLAQSLILGLLHGPAELLPVSSSGHVAVLPWLLGWDYTEIDPELRKAFEVALHAGTTVGLVVGSGQEIVGHLDRRRILLDAIAATPPAVTGYLFKRRIARELGTAPTIAAGLIAGAGAMLLSERTPQRRASGDAVPADGVWLGLAQALALAPGISRSGSTLAAARLRGFTRTAAARLSKDVGLPVIAGATALEAVGLRHQGLERDWANALVTGAGAALVSTLAASRLIGADAGTPLTGWALYRLGLAAVILAKLRSGKRP